MNYKMTGTFSALTAIHFEGKLDTSFLALDDITALVLTDLRLYKSTSRVWEGSARCGKVKTM